MHRQRYVPDKSALMLPLCSFLDIAMSAFMDIAFAVYPGMIVWSLQMPLWKKLSTMALMGLGLV